MMATLAQTANTSIQNKLNRTIHALNDWGILQDREYVSIYLSSGTRIETRDGRIFDADLLLEDTFDAHITGNPSPAALLNLRRANRPNIMIYGTPPAIAHHVAENIQQAIDASEAPDHFQQYCKHLIHAAEYALEGFALDLGSGSFHETAATLDHWRTHRPANFKDAIQSLERLRQYATEQPADDDMNKVMYLAAAYARIPIQCPWAEQTLDDPSYSISHEPRENFQNAIAASYAAGAALHTVARNIDHNHHDIPGASVDVPPFVELARLIDDHLPNLTVTAAQCIQAAVALERFSYGDTSFKAAREHARHHLTIHRFEIQPNLRALRDRVGNPQHIHID